MTAIEKALTDAGYIVPTQKQFGKWLSENNGIKNSQKKLLAPNGKPSKLTPKQYAQVRTPEFKAWFGDWENDPANASKVVDENGEPVAATSK